jgi:hypothetical protein
MELKRGKLYLHANGFVYRYHGDQAEPIVDPRCVDECVPFCTCCAAPVVFHTPSFPMSDDGSVEGVGNNPNALVRELTKADLPLLLRIRGRQKAQGQAAEGIEFVLAEFGWQEPDPTDPRHISADPIEYLTVKLERQKAAGEDTTDTEGWLKKLAV